MAIIQIIQLGVVIVELILLTNAVILSFIMVLPNFYFILIVMAVLNRNFQTFYEHFVIYLILLFIILFILFIAVRAFTVLQPLTINF